MLPAVTGLTEWAVEVPGVRVTEGVRCDESAVVVEKIIKVKQMYDNWDTADIYNNQFIC